MSTVVCPSTDVVKYSLASVGIVVLRAISTLTMPPRVSIPSESGVTSSSSMSVMPPARICAWTAAPSATTSSGFMRLCGVRPNSSSTRRCTSGIRVEPPTSTTSSTWSARERGVREGLPARAEGRGHQRLHQGLDLGPGDVAVVGEALERDREHGALVEGEPALRGLRAEADLLQRLRVPGEVHAGAGCWMSARSQSTIARSKSSPPRCVLPLVASTSKTPSFTRRIEMSKVPPPRS